MKIRGFQGKKPKIGERVFVDPSAVVIGGVSLGDDCSIWPMAVVRGDVEDITIGARTSIQDGSVLHVSHDGPYSPGGRELSIGEDVTVGHSVTLHACTIGDRCLVGMNSCVLDGAVVGDEVLLAAGSLVPPGRQLKSGHLYRGNPVEQVRALGDDEIEMMRYSAAHYVRLKNRYLGLG